MSDAPQFSMQRITRYYLLINIGFPDGVDRSNRKHVSTTHEGQPIGLAGVWGILFGCKDIDGGKLGSAVSIVWNIIVFLLVASYVVGDCKKQVSSILSLQTEHLKIE